MKKKERQMKIFIFISSTKTRFLGTNPKKMKHILGQFLAKKAQSFFQLKKFTLAFQC
jgi:hypothetical protein